MTAPFISQTRASAGTVTFVPTAWMSPSRMTIVPASSVSPGLTTTLPPTSAWAPGGSGRNPGGSSSPAVAVNRKVETNAREIALQKSPPNRFMGEQCAEESAARQAALERNDLAMLDQVSCKLEAPEGWRSPGRCALYKP